MTKFFNTKIARKIIRNLSHIIEAISHAPNSEKVADIFGRSCIIFCEFVMLKLWLRVMDTYVIEFIKLKKKTERYSYRKCKFRKDSKSKFFSKDSTFLSCSKYSNTFLLLKFVAFFTSQFTKKISSFLRLFLQNNINRLFKF